MANIVRGATPQIGVNRSVKRGHRAAILGLMHIEEGALLIVADDREPVDGVIAELERIDGVRVIVRRLVAGDYLVDSRFAVERKTLADFGQSLVDGRLFTQAAKLAAGSARAVLVLEGPAEAWEASRVGRESLQGAIIALSVFQGLAILRAEDAADTARLLVYLAAQAERSVNESIPRPGRRPKRKRARQLYFLQGLPGVGPERAARLLEKFGSPEAVVSAPEEELSEVRGVGETTARGIRWVLGQS